MSDSDPAEATLPMTGSFRLSFFFEGLELSPPLFTSSWESTVADGLSKEGNLTLFAVSSSAQRDGL
jgi:hypothetical protein